MKTLNKSVLALSILTAGSAQAFELTSNDIQEGHPMAKTFEYSSWGCNGENLSPQLMWKDAPAGTKSFAITAYDPDAPTESGFWHWVVFDIPATGPTLVGKLHAQTDSWSVPILLIASVAFACTIFAALAARDKKVSV